MSIKLDSIEEAFMKVWKLNEKSEKEQREKPRNFAYPVPVSNVVVAARDSGEKVLCFYADPVRETLSSNATAESRTRYVLPISEVVQFVNSMALNSEHAKDLKKQYGIGFKPRRPLRDLQKELRRPKSFEELLGSEIYQVLKNGKGTIQRSGDILFHRIHNDEVFALLRKTAETHKAANPY